MLHNFTHKSCGRICKKFPHLCQITKKTLIVIQLIHSDKTVGFPLQMSLSLYLLLSLFWQNTSLSDLYLCNSHKNHTLTLCKPGLPTTPDGLIQQSHSIFHESSWKSMNLSRLSNISCNLWNTPSSEHKHCYIRVVQPPAINYKGIRLECGGSNVRR